MKTYDEMKTTLVSEQYNENNEFQKSSIELYKDYIYEISDPLELLLRKLELISLSENDNILESAISKDTLSNLPDKFKGQSISSNVPSCVPYFTPEEITTFGESNEFVEDYRRHCITGLYDFDYSEQFSQVQELYKEYTESHSILLEQKIISLGWNPSVEPNDKNMSIAVSRITKYLDENYDIDIIDLTESKSPDIKTNNPVLFPIFIVLSFTNTAFGKVINAWKHGNYSHASIAFEPDLKHLYSFNFDNKLNTGGGLSFESIQDYLKEFNDSRIKVMAVFVDANAKAKIHAKLDYFISNVEKTRYDIINIFRIVFNKAGSDDFNLKMICSQFVDAILRVANIDITNKSTNLVAPSDFEKNKNNKVFVVYEGLIRDYNPEAVSNKVKALASKKSSKYKNIEIKEAVDLILHNVDPFLYKSINITNESANEILEQVVYLLTANAVISESLRLPFSFNKDGDLEINFPDQLEEEYQKSHKLLLQYDEADNIEGMKNELAKLWYLNNIAEKKMKGMKKDETIKTRARILNDFKKYLGKVLDKEKNFNFTEYFNNSPYYDKSVTVDASTLHWSGRLLKSLILK